MQPRKTKAQKRGELIMTVLFVVMTLPLFVMAYMTIFGLLYKAAVWATSNL